MHLRTVVFPLPDGPTSASSSPAPHSNATSSLTGRSWRRRTRRPPDSDPALMSRRPGPGRAPLLRLDLSGRVDLHTRSRFPGVVSLREGTRLRRLEDAPEARARNGRRACLVGPRRSLASGQAAGAGCFAWWSAGRKVRSDPDVAAAERAHQGHRDERGAEQHRRRAVPRLPSRMPAPDRRSRLTASGSGRGCCPRPSAPPPNSPRVCANVSTNAASTPGQAMGSSMRASVAGLDNPLTHAASRISWGMAANACCIGRIGERQVEDDRRGDETGGS